MYPSPTNAERYADGAVHIIGLTAVLTGCLTLVIFSAFEFGAALFAACVIYAISMTASFAISASYHLLPHHHWRLGLRRMDHAAIYALIAGTFTPLLVFVGSLTAYTILAAVWVLAIPAMLYKIFGTHIEPRWSMASYLGLGWIGAIAIPDFWASLSTSALVACGAGGFFYTFGAILFSRKTQPFRYSIWHIFVLLGTLSFFIAIWLSLFG
ncbi:PAQR family membrane homeostasis protein TrhA [Pontixanthobacter gangjinensis]|uniref:Hemolysin n=1 Tax=Pontixanthobacter gangjinensis TaxID=1028742 RepID=A0A6I4SMQ1_9SPHN|nr:hemolysin III family protein [Pontixanthobacter gangjinensis]MXO57055.1 hemolysin [Pontixanthobacter gangjinensis]